jgi:hypothetical protein
LRSYHVGTKHESYHQSMRELILRLKRDF